MLTQVGCDKELGMNPENLRVSEPSDVDADAGNWRLIVLTSTTQIPVAAPAAVDDPTYQAELSAIKDAQANLTDDQRSAIDYWSAGGVLRWNQIMRELVARYNLAPAPNANNTYPGPDSENPFSDPVFPFANPPYAARAYSYVSVGQYDALKVAWYYKYLYNRKAPYNVDSGIKALVPATDLPSYPSEDAVESGVTAELLKALFPAAVEEITEKAAQQRNAALWSGKASSSDIAAGLALGKAVAAAMLARAAGDGMKTSVGNPAQWKTLADSAYAHWARSGVTQANVVPWVSLDVPARPPMLPFFGTKTATGLGVAGWIMNTQDFVQIRPGPPATSTSDEMIRNVAEVQYFSDHLTRERLAIVHKWADGLGTYTPPGHWNDIAEEYISDAHFSEVRTARAFALLNMAIHNAGVACWEAKYYYYNPRPTQLQSTIKTGTGIPNFPSYPSGHSTFSASAAEVLAYLFPTEADHFRSLAQEAALSRLYGAIHTREDCDVGVTHGKAVGDYMVNYAINLDGGN